MEFTRARIVPLREIFDSVVCEHIATMDKRDLGNHRTVFGFALQLFLQRPPNHSRRQNYCIYSSFSSNGKIQKQTKHTDGHMLTASFHLSAVLLTGV
jgi:hypothetical protein